MGKTARKLLALVLLFFVSTSSALAYDFLGLNPKMEEHVSGDAKNIKWDDNFLAEVEAYQASILRQISTYENYWIDRQITGVEVTIDDSWLGKLFKNKKNIFTLSDQLMPKSNKCANTDTDKHAVMSEASDITRSTNEIRDGKNVRVYHEFTARITGYGWNCEGKSQESFWVDDIKKEGVDDEYIEEYKRKTKDLKSPAFDWDVDEDRLFDGSNGKYFVQMQKARDYVTENCVCKLKEQATEEK